MPSSSDGGGVEPISFADFPEARTVEPRRRSIAQFFTPIWLVAIFCAIAAIGLLLPSFNQPHHRITISFQDGHGIEAGDTIRLRGIDVGTIESVVLQPDLQRVLLTAILTPEARPLARAGTRFWIERPQVSLSSVRGLETVVGPKYVAVQPGPADASPQDQFEGVELPRQSSESSTVRITIRFAQGHGLKVGSAVRFRGVQVGEVVDVRLNRSLSHVLLDAELLTSAADLAREGSLFWIERPQVSLGGVRSLDTLVTGAYLAVAPASIESPPASDFEGLEKPPAEVEASSGLEVVVQSDATNGLQTGSPVIYRGVPIGKVVQVGLASDASSVETRVIIESTYRELVCDNSRFWPTSGVELKLGLTGVKLDAESLESIVAGGLTLATPDAPGRPVAAGHRFALDLTPESDWLNWRPQIPVGPRFLPDRQPTPITYRGSFLWKRKRWGMTRAAQQVAWVHPLGDGRLLCPSSFDDDDTPPADLVLEVEGQRIVIAEKNFKRSGSVGFLSSSPLQKNAQRFWKPSQLRSARVPEDSVVVAGGSSFPLAASRLRSGPLWQIDLALPLTEQWHGAAVVARKDGALIGLVIWREEQAWVAPLGDVGQGGK